MRCLKLQLALALPLLLAACASVETPAPPPQAAYVGVTPAYEVWFKDLVDVYWVDQPGNGVIPLVFPLAEAIESADQLELELVVSASTPPPEWFATPLYADAIAIMAHPALGDLDLSIQEMDAIFAGEVESWLAFTGEPEEILPIIPPEGDELRAAFQATVLQGARYTSNALLAPHPEAALELVEDRPGAIAIIPWTALAQSHTPLRLEGVRLSSTTIENDRYPLIVQVNAFALEEPAGAMRQFLGWLQATLASGS
jgi:hypothetical protein